MKEVENYYFRAREGLISGIYLEPVQENVHFIKCRFHSDCAEVQFKDCTFTDCDIPFNPITLQKEQ